VAGGLFGFRGAGELVIWWGGGGEENNLWMSVFVKLCAGHNVGPL
jgi:hypothetical protein